MDYAEGKRVARQFQDRGLLRPVAAGPEAADPVMAGARARLEKARVAVEEGRWAEAYADAHEAYLAAADAAVLLLGFHGAPRDGESAALAVAHAALKLETDAFARAAADAMAAGLVRPAFPAPSGVGGGAATSADDAAWALDLAARAVHATDSALAAARLG